MLGSLPRHAWPPSSSTDGLGWATAGVMGVEGVRRWTPSGLGSSFLFALLASPRGVDCGKSLLEQCCSNFVQSLGPCWLSTVLAQGHFFSDSLSLHLTNQNHMVMACGMCDVPSLRALSWGMTNEH